MNNKNTMCSLLVGMLKIGCIGFGGGSALIPMLEQEFVQKRKLVSQKEIDEDILVATLTPGALPVEIASGIGFRVAGRMGMILSALAISLPGCLLMLCVLALFQHGGSGLIYQLNYLIIVIELYIILLLMKYMLQSILQFEQRKERMWSLFLMILVGAIASTGILGSIEIMALYFITMFLYGIFHRKEEEVPVIKNSLKPSGAVMSWMLVLALVFAVCFLLLANRVEFFLKGFVSVIFSYGGGDAYLTAADDIFVKSEMLDGNIFYTQVVSTANVLPGSMMCKVLAGVGFVLGKMSGGSFFAGIGAGLAGWVLAIAVSGLVFSGADMVFIKMKNKTTVELLQKWTRSIVSGLLAAVVQSMVISILALW